MAALTVGQQLRRREPVNDAWDRISVNGVFDCGETRELVVAPALGFAAPICTTAESLLQIYTLDIEGPPEMKTWKTPLEEVTA